MAKTAAERKQKQRQTLKEKGLFENFRKKESEADKLRKRSMKAAASGKVLSSIRKKKAEAMRRYRKKQKEKNVSSSETSKVFANRSTYGKAMAKAMRNLPVSPTKCRAVVTKLAKQITPDIVTHKKGKCHKTLSLDTLEKVKDFYARDDTSRQSPGIKDTIIVRSEDGKKTKMQQRNLFSNLLETHALFCEEFGDIIGKSKFAEVRPKHILLSSQTPENLCLCKYHENYILAVNALSKHCTEIPTYSKDFLTQFALCELPTESCWYENCSSCKTMINHKLEAASYNSKDKIVSWFEWKEQNGRLTKVALQGTLLQLCGHIFSMTPTFKEHNFVKRNQAQSYNNDRIDCMKFGCNFALLQVDFAENYTCISQDEIQSYHWVQPQVSIFTASLWYHEVQHSSAIVSDNLHHNKNTVMPYIDRMLQEIPSDIEEVRIWSDGPASQFKNRYIANCLPMLELRHDFKISWNFFATSHGKGPVDGIGGALKRQVRTAVMRREHVVTNAIEFVGAVNKNSKIHVILMDNEDIKQIYDDLSLSSVFDESPAIKDVTKIHKIYVNKFNFVKASKLSCCQKTIYEEVYSEDSSDEI